MLWRHTVRVKTIRTAKNCKRFDTYKMRSLKWEFSVDNKVKILI